MVYMHFDAIVENRAQYVYVMSCHMRIGIWNAILPYITFFLVYLEPCAFRVNATSFNHGSQSGVTGIISVYCKS